jgi:pimeloyl-ACP methyl ester carboxylesterase
MSQYTTPNLTIDASNGTRYAYRRFGRARTPPVVFFQHFRGNLDGWDPDLVDDIAAEHDVILFDAGGVGLSSGTVPASFHESGRDALAFIDALCLTEVDLFGFSIGGFVAQEVALQRPHLVRRLILAGTGPQGGREMHGRPAEPRAHAMRDVQDADDILYLFFTPSQTSQAKGAEFVGRIFKRTEGRDAGHIPNARLSIYPDANHGFLFQYPHAFAAEVNGFLAGS